MIFLGMAASFEVYRRYSPSHSTQFLGSPSVQKNDPPPTLPYHHQEAQVLLLQVEGCGWL